MAKNPKRLQALFEMRAFAMGQLAQLDTEIALAYADEAADEVPEPMRNMREMARKTIAAVPKALRNRRSVVYFIRQGDDGPVKVGTSHDLQLRLQQLQGANPHPLKILVAVPGDEKREVEIHFALAKHRLHGEWFAAHPEVLEFIEGVRATASGADDG
jgi:hypothetical protein